MSNTAVIVFTRTATTERKPFGLGSGAQHVLPEALLAHAVTIARRGAGGRADLVVAADGDVTRWAPDCPVIAQRGDTFEERLLHALHDVAARGYRRLVVIGSDTPGICADDLERALDVPGGACAIGPSRDGGFYLIAIDAARLSLLRGLPWQHQTILATLLARLDAAGVGVAWLPQRHDIDNAVDSRRSQGLLEKLCRELLDTSLSGRPIRTRRFVPYRLNETPSYLATSVTSRAPPAPIH